jgi:hypothetical protein
MPARRSRPLATFLTLVVLLLTLVAACGISTAEPAPTPADFPGVASEITKQGVLIRDIVSGDAGCQDPVLVPTSIGFTMSGLDQTKPVRTYLYIFRNREAYERLRASVDDCARSFVTDPATFESIEQSPFVLAGQGPWAPGFKAALRAALGVAAGTGD